jgi:hypothetical protein
VYSAAVNGGSGYFDGSGDSLQIPNNTFNVSSSDITIELWAYFLSISSTHIILELGSGASGDLQFYAEGNVVKFGSSGTAKTGVAIAINQWHHLAAVKTGNTYYLYVDGIRNTSQSSGSASASTVINIGSRNNSSLYTFGYISNFRISNFARYTTSTIAVPTSPVSADANTVVLLNFTNAAITDATAKNVLETVGDARISTAQSKWTGGSIAVTGGAANYLVSSDIKNYTLSGAFTIEGWVYRNSSTARAIFIEGRTTGGYANYLFGILQNGTVEFVTSNSANFYNPAETVASGQWVHVALVRDTSNVVKCYINGVGASTTKTISGILTPAASSVWLGGQRDPFYSDAYINDFRISYFARYTANFTPPSGSFRLR